MEIRAQESDHEVMISVASPDQGITITDAPGGAFTILIDRTTLMQQLQPGDFVTDLVRLMPNGYQERLFEGIVTVVEGTTSADGNAKFDRRADRTSRAAGTAGLGGRRRTSGADGSDRRAGLSRIGRATGAAGQSRADRASGATG